MNKEQIVYKFGEWVRVTNKHRGTFDKIGRIRGRVGTDELHTYRVWIMGDREYTYYPEEIKAIQDGSAVS